MGEAEAEVDASGADVANDNGNNGGEMDGDDEDGGASQDAAGRSNGRVDVAL